jgi:hypothetical protein
MSRYSLRLAILESRSILISLMATEPKTVTFSYEKSENFSVAYVDGATARPLPSGNIYLSFFLERGHEFEAVTNQLDSEGNLGKEIDRKIKDGILRELQVAIIASPAAAKRICALITETVEKAEAISGQARKASGK